MIYAELEDGKRIQASQYVDLLKLKQKNTKNKKEFYCPGCKEKVFLKNGTKKIPHFSHYGKTNCHSFSEGETEAHLKGKTLLQKWCLSQGLTVEMEAWLPSLQQRPDLLITLDDGAILALDYQCSPISYEKLVERTEGYRSIGCQVLWICGMEYVPTNRLLNKHTNFFIWSRETGAGFLCLDTLSDSFIRYYNFLYNDYNQLKWDSQRVLLKQTDIEEFIKLYDGRFSKKKPIVVIGKIGHRLGTEHQRFHLLRKRDPEHHFFLEQLYLQRQELHMLPDFLFQSPTHSIFFHTPAYIWKYFFLCWLENKEDGAILNQNQLLSFMQACKQGKLIHVRPIPFIEEHLTLFPLYSFMNELVEREIIIVIGEQLWLLSKTSLSKFYHDHQTTNE